MSQNNPIPNNNRPIVDLVKEDLDKRAKTGLRTYGTKLQAFNGRNSVQDFYEEELDKIQYIKQWLLERKEIINVLKFYANETNGQNAKELLISLNEL